MFSKNSHFVQIRNLAPIKLADIRNQHHDHSELNFIGSRINTSHENLSHDRNLALHYASARGKVSK